MSERTPLLDICNLVVGFGSAERPSVRDVSLRVAKGEIAALVGESGSGKSVTVKSVMRLIDYAGGSIRSGKIMLHGTDGAVDLASATQEQMQAIRGVRIAMIFQEPMTSLNPVLTIGSQLMEALRQHQRLAKAVARAECIRLLEQVRITEPERRFSQYPHEMSGGMRQRVMIAMALACKPDLLVADEPTTALDVTVQAEILALLRRVQSETGMAVLFITHDMGVVAEIADFVTVMLDGEVVESGPVMEVFENPRHDYTRTLLAAAPHLGQGCKVQLEAVAPVGSDTGSTLALKVENLTVRYPVRSRILRRHNANLHAVEDVSFTLNHGETLAIVGESGCGKSTLARTLLKLNDPTSGRVMLKGRELGAMSAKELLEARAGIQMVFQDPYASLNPRMTVAEILSEPFHIHHKGWESSILDEVCALLERVGLPESVLKRYPHQFSGGQRQRICIARALMLKPSVIIADEPVSALDVAIQGQILDLLADLQRDFNVAMLFISHDMAVVEKVSDRVAVMYRGSIVETGPTNKVLANPQHSYTRRLLEAVPAAHPRLRHKRTDAPFVSYSPVFPKGCEIELPAMIQHEEDHWVRPAVPSKHAA
ncbi:ABC transporter ATP-binding protein [Mesorhizobium sp. SB112]|uniref:ABC transporter ATP-binding protein n=1 Tax=Mesorhizobium sp. SB112 TaxID=3151853 RepID=UPI003263C50E